MTVTSRRLPWKGSGYNYILIYIDYAMTYLPMLLVNCKAWFSFVLRSTTRSWGFLWGHIFQLLHKLSCILVTFCISLHLFLLYPLVLLSRLTPMLLFLFLCILSCWITLQLIISYSLFPFFSYVAGHHRKNKNIMSLWLRKLSGSLVLGKERWYTFSEERRELKQTRKTNK